MEKIIERNVGIATHLGGHTLMPFTDPVELSAWHTLNGDALAGRSGELEALSQRAFFLRAFGHDQLENFAPPGTQALVNRIASVNQFSHFSDFRL